MENHVLYGKTSAPPPTGQFLYRPKINSLLQDALKTPITTVTAGAGFGKSQAVSSVVNAGDYNVVWLQLSELDNLVTRIWERFIFAYQCYDETLASGLVALGFPASAQSFDQFLRLVAEKTIDNKPWVIVLDDFHLIYEKEILRFVERIGFAQIQNLALVLISRTPPDISVASMMTKGLLTRITEADLRFSQSEMQQYFEMQGMHVPEQTVVDLYTYTDGWILAIHLVGLSYKQAPTRAEGFNEHPANSVREDVFDLIGREVFYTSSPALQTFLLKISLLDTLPVALLRALSQDQPSVLSEMMNMSLLIYDDAFLPVVRIHHLFREYLSTKQASLTAEEINHTLLTAAHWYDCNNEDIDAIMCYQKCDHYEEIFDKILQYSNRIPKALANFFIKIIEQAPAHFLEARPIMRVVRAKYILNNNRVAEAYVELTNLRKKYELLAPTEQNKEVLGETLLHLGILCFVIKTLDFPELFKQADAYLPKGSTIVNNRMMLVGGEQFLYY